MSVALDHRTTLMLAEDQKTSEFVTVAIAGQHFGIPVLHVQDVLAPHRISRIPLAPDWVAGALNLRGRIVTAIDLRRKLGLDDEGRATKQMSIVIEHRAELYGLLVDEVGEVLAISNAAITPNPATLDPVWRQVSVGIVQLPDKLMAILDVDTLFESSEREPA